jgi:capsular polysaccharide transport system permease protein
MTYRYRLVMFLLLFVIPLGLFTYYELALATNRYHSDSKIFVSSEDSVASPIDLSLIGLPSSSGSQDSQSLIAFMTSLEMLQLLDKRLDLREHYSNPQIDWWSRLPTDASQEDFYTYMTSFSREFANAVVKTLLEEGQVFVDRLNSGITKEKTEFFEKELSQSEARLSKERTALLDFQREHNLLTTESEAKVIESTIGSLTSTLVAKKGQLEAEGEKLNESSPVIRNLRTEIKILQEQIRTEKDRLAGGGSGVPVSELSAEFAEIQGRLEFVQAVFKSNLTQLEGARMEAAKRLKYLVVVVRPSVADASLYPDRPYNIITAVIILLVFFFISTLMVAIVREHS